MKKVIAISGTKRKKNTYSLLLQIRDILQQNNIELEIIELYDYNIQPCAGCTACVLNGKCILKDDTDYIMKRLCDCDGIILATPVYLNQVSGMMKKFIDRTCVWVHRPELISKPVLGLSTTKGSGLKNTLSYIKDVTIQWGASYAGGIGRTIFSQDKKISKKELAKFINLINNPYTYSPSLNQLIEFQVQKSLAMFINEKDKCYWQEKKWTDKKFYFKCKYSPVKCMVSSLIGNSMRKGMSKRKKTS